MLKIFPGASDGYLSSQSVRQPNHRDACAQRTSSADAIASSCTLDDTGTTFNSPDGQAHGLSPEDLRSKISALITGEVRNGKLSDDQAADLQSMFADAFDDETTELSFSDDGDDLLDQDLSPSSSGDTSSLLQSFLKMIENAQDIQMSYDSVGSGSPVSSRGAVLLNYTA